MSDLKLKKSDIKKINKKLLESLQNYRKMVHYMTGDMPIGVLCLQKQTEKVLIDNGILRVYELFDRDFTKIKGIGKVRIRDLTTCLDKFLAMS
jgi:hypothetical protein